MYEYLKHMRYMCKSNPIFARHRTQRENFSGRGSASLPSFPHAHTVLSGEYQFKFEFVFLFGIVRYMRYTYAYRKYNHKNSNVKLSILVTPGRFDFYFLFFLPPPKAKCGYELNNHQSTGKKRGISPSGV